MRSMKGRLSGNREPEQQQQSSGGTYQEGLVMTEGTGPTHREWDESAATGSEAISFEKGSSLQQSLQPGLTTHKQQSFQQYQGSGNLPSSQQQQELHQQFTQNVPQQGLRDWSQSTQPSQSSKPTEQGYTQLGQEQSFDSSRREGQREGSLRGWSQSSQPMYDSHIQQQGLGEWQFPEEPLYQGGRQGQSSQSRMEYSGQRQYVPAQQQHQQQPRAVSIPVEIPVPMQPVEQPAPQLQQRVVMEEEIRERPIVEQQERMLRVPITEEKVRMTTQEVDVPVIERAQRVVTAPVREAIITHEQREEEVPVVHRVAKTISVPKVMMRRKEIDVPFLSKIKKIVEIEVEQDVINWQKRTIEEPYIDYENQEVMEEVVTTERKLIDVPRVEEVTKEIQIPVTEQRVVFQRQKVQVPVVEKQQRFVEQPVVQERVTMVPEVVEVPKVETILAQPPPAPAPEQEFVTGRVNLQFDVSQEARVEGISDVRRTGAQQQRVSGQQQFGEQRLGEQQRLGDQGSSGQRQLALEEVLQRKHRQQEQFMQGGQAPAGQYNIQHDANRGSLQPLE